MSTLAGMDRAHVNLIESRLNSIERNLMDSGISRRRRHEIVQDVERQIYQLVSAHPGELSRAVVLQILGTLDPPEAYSGEPGEFPVRAAGYTAVATPLAPTATTVFGQTAVAPHACTSPQCIQRPVSSFAFAALVLAGLSIPAVIMIPIGTILALAGAICGGVAWFQISASGGRLRGKWMAVFSFVMLAIHACIIGCILVSM